MTPAGSAPLVTVGIPFHDEEAHLGAAIRSILGQTERDLEVLLVDDGSRDGSLAVARSFAGDPRVRILSDGARRHLPARLNEIVRNARGRFVARMDADDVSHPRRLAAELEVLSKQPRVDVVGCGAALVGDDEEPFAVAELATLPPTPAEAVTRGILAHATILGRREWFLANPYDEALTRAEDRDLWCRTCTTSTFAGLPEVLYVVRVTVDDARFLPGYLESQRQTREIYLRYGPHALGMRATAALFLGSLAKGVVMRAAHHAGFSSRIVRRRGRAPTAEERRLVREALDAARAQAP